MGECERDARPCTVCGEDVLGRDFVQVDGQMLFVIHGDRDDPAYLAREDYQDGEAEYFCRGCIGSFEEMMWVRVDKERAIDA